MCELHDGAAIEERITPRSVVDFTEELVVAVTNRRIYGTGHARVVASLLNLEASLKEILSWTENDALILGRADGFLFHEGQPLLGASLVAPRVIQPLTVMGSGGIVFRTNATQTDFAGVVELLGEMRREEEDYEDCNKRLKRQGCSKIELLPPFKKGASSAGTRDHMTQMFGTSGAVAQEAASLFSLDIPVRLYQSIVDHLQDVMIDAYHGKTLRLDTTRHFVEHILERLAVSPRSMLSISRYEQYDAYTFGHSIRVCCLALNFACALTEDRELLHRIGVAALLHDIGKAWVPFDVLHSTVRLTDAQRVEMNKHTMYGAKILLEMGDADPMTVSAAWGHHRATGRRGYPLGQWDTRISTTTKLVKLCDVYETLTAVRPYKDRMSPLRAYRIMMSMRNHFDPALLGRFISNNGLYPVGSRVRLSTGELACVQQQTERYDAPIVEVDTASEGEPLPLDERRQLNLATQTAGDRIEVREMLLGAEMV